MKSIKELCRELRKNQTPAEAALWKVLRNRQLNQFKFLRQHPLIVQHMQGKKAFYIADFYCSEKKLIIEADGGVHKLQKEYDANRDEVIAALGIKVLRFENEEILGNEQQVLAKIVYELMR